MASAARPGAFVAGLLLMAMAAESPASTWSQGDVFVATGNGRYKIFDNDGKFEGTLSDGTDGFTTGGCLFNESGDRLYTTNASTSMVFVHDVDLPHDIVATIEDPVGFPGFLARAANGDLLVGSAFTNTISRFDPGNGFVKSYQVSAPGGFDRIASLALSSDQRTIFYTSVLYDRILRYDLDTETQLTDFATLPAGSAFDLRLLPPGDGSGGMIVAAQSAIYRLNGSGAVVRTYDADERFNYWQALDLDPNGTSFWASAADDEELFRFNIASGEVELGPVKAKGSHFGLCVAGNAVGPYETDCSDIADDDGDDLIDCDDPDCSSSPDCDSYCARPCGRPASRVPGAPLASDALFTLREAVGITSLCLPCECDVDGNGMTTATDALTILRVVVGVPVTLQCPSCGPMASETAFERGRAAMEFQDLSWANRQFGCAVDARPANSEAELFYAMTRVLAYVDADPEWRELLEETGGDGATDVFNFTLAFADGFEIPTIARGRPVLLDGLAAELDAAIENLKRPISDEDFQTTITAKMSPGSLFGSTFELDAADAAVLSSSYRLMRCFLYFTIGAYHSSTFDLLHHDPAATACESTFVGDHPQFFTIASNAAMTVAKAECEDSIGDTIKAYDAMEAETDSQFDDLLVLDDVMQPDDPRDLRDTLVELRQSFQQETSSLPACDDRPFSFHTGRFFDAPLTRADLPDFSYTDKCIVDEDSFPDLSFNGALPDELPVDDLGRLLFKDVDDWPLCKHIKLPGLPF